MKLRNVGHKTVDMRKERNYVSTILKNSNFKKGKKLSDQTSIILNSIGGIKEKLTKILEKTKMDA